LVGLRHQRNRLCRCYPVLPAAGATEVLLIAISAGLNAVISIVSWMAETSSNVFWTLIDLSSALTLVLWATGVCLLFRELAQNEKPDA
jgi:hypothetical protein